jgi:hypothetical protein
MEGKGVSSLSLKGQKARNGYIRFIEPGALVPIPGPMILLISALLFPASDRYGEPMQLGIGPDR